MKLSKTNIKKQGRLSLKGVKVPKTEPRPTKPFKRIPSEEEKLLEEMVAKNKHIKELIARFGLVHNGRVSRIPGEEETTPSKKGKLSLEDIAKGIMDRERSYSPEELIDKIQAFTGVERARAEKGLKLLIVGELIEDNGQGSYFLKGSTPF